MTKDPNLKRGVLGKVGGGGVLEKVGGAGKGGGEWIFFDKLTKNPNLKKKCFLTKNPNQICKTKTGKKWRGGGGGLGKGK